MSEANAGDLGKELKDLVAEIIEVDPENITNESDFVEDLGMDSMQALEIMAAVEKKYSIQIPEDYLGKVMNLSSLIQIADNIINGN